ncbi:Hypothetical predicted protein [Marmota monax]|uniref:Uncharacterized protein n=2 Tax=Marmota monax TaxID=9995 RepID=A0A5E4CS35_MARMO|nr:hypothetical protein GHT09_005817 [Marmota monax]VTJ84615.1 Hypothetical predicted protein [Marmota monax]
MSLLPMQPVRGCQAGFQEPSLPKPLSSAQERDLLGNCLVFSLFSLQEQRQTTENRELLAQAWNREIELTRGLATEEAEYSSNQLLRRHDGWLQHHKQQHLTGLPSGPPTGFTFPAVNSLYEQTSFGFQ